MAIAVCGQDHSHSHLDDRHRRRRDAHRHHRRHRDITALSVVVILSVRGALQPPSAFMLSVAQYVNGMVHGMVHGIHSHT